MLITSENCKVITDNFIAPETVIETTFNVWQDISQKKMSGSTAIMKKLMRVSGNFDVMFSLDNLFSTGRRGNLSSEKNTDIKENRRGKSNINILLIPFIIFWLSLPFSAYWGGLITIMAAAITLVFSIKIRFSKFDYFSMALALTLAVVSIISGNKVVMTSLSYILFALLWAASCLTDIPLTAYYSINDYDASYMDNPVFIRTNRILTGSWALAYLLVSPVVYFLISSSFRFYTGIITAVFFAFMGMYTNWFKKYYPATLAKK